MYDSKAWTLTVLWVSSITDKIAFSISFFKKLWISASGMGSRGSNVFRALNTSSFSESCGRSTPFEPRSKCLKWKQQRPGFCLSYLRIHTGLQHQTAQLPWMKDCELDVAYLKVLLHQLEGLWTSVRTPSSQSQDQTWNIPNMNRQNQSLLNICKNN